MLFTGQKCVTLEKFQCHISPPYSFSHFLETFTPIIELLSLESARRHQVNTLYNGLFEYKFSCLDIFGGHFLNLTLFCQKIVVKFKMF
jgi:hypothetical protein